MPPHSHLQHHHHSHCHSSPPSPSPCCSFSSPPPSSPSCCSCCCGCCPSSQPPPSPPPPDQMVVLLQSLLSNQLHIPNPPSSDHHLLQTLANHLPKPYPQPPQRQHKDPDNKTQSLLLSLLRRVSALESQLPDLSRPPPPPPPQPVVPASAAPKLSLRDVAARTIQARFREFLVRRSRTLRHLKQLAALKSHAAALRSSLSGKVRVADSERVSQRAMDLLLQLDSIQSSDLMIREGKKSITRELTRILEFIDKVSPKGNLNPIKEDGAGTDRRRHWQNSKAVKRVSFSEFDSYAPFAEDLIDLGGEMERLDEEHVEDAELEVENGLSFGIGRKLGLYAPMPVHMEPRES
ncbi:BAG family molecular chaperone regulator 8, chloroplastic [Dioscorea cayenensis subsp. rotundata]|uniref:BAG family molecular chaperone regulator 8, chloroplastic n=1 Tax=Dioscorea cayennensis subsp. rotundata TaxID=55577 RepID=A0AB40CJ82_DIOCR|nr:BAG family molecular chaperone regulator 8, chloroplastic [Dioscorea cayenensis subsp. rotundata]